MHRLIIFFISLGGILFCSTAGFAQIADRPSGEHITLNSTWELSQDEKIEEGHSLLLLPGGRIILNGHALILEGNVQLLSNDHIFVGDGDVLFTTNSVSELNPLWWGAIPNDGIADHDAIQKAVNSGIASKGVSNIYFPAGEYIIDKPIMLLKHSRDNKSYGFFNLSLSSNQMPYGTNANVGGVAVLRTSSLAAIVIQSCRGLTIENIAIKGPYERRFVLADHITWTEEQLLENYSHPHGPYNPSAGIIIDPFHKNHGSRIYNNWRDYYKGNSGSSWIKIRGCTIENFPVGIAISPHGNLTNAENITIEKVKIKGTLVAVATCQSQSRQVQVQNCTFSFIRIAFDSYTYGGGRGTLPEVIGLNASKNIGWLFKANSGYAAGHFTQVYAENIFGLGYGSQNKNTHSFLQCNFKFPPSYESGGVINPSELECGTAMFSGCTLRRGKDKEGIDPVNFHVKNLTVLNSRINVNLFNNGKKESLPDGNVEKIKPIVHRSGAHIQVSVSQVNVTEGLTPIGDPVEGDLVASDSMRSFISGAMLRSAVGYVNKVLPDGSITIKSTSKSSKE